MMTMIMMKEAIGGIYIYILKHNTNIFYSYLYSYSYSYYYCKLNMFINNKLKEYI